MLKTEVVNSTLYYFTFVKKLDSVGLVMAFRPTSSSTSMFSYSIENFSYLRSFIRRKYKALALKEVLKHTNVITLKMIRKTKISGT